MARRYWLMKSDPDTFGWPELLASRDRTTCWDGVRNYQARNFLRDDVQEGDGVLFYHSQTDKAVVGLARVVRSGYVDPTQFAKKDPYYDAKSKKDAPRWYAVDIRAEKELPDPVTLDRMKDEPSLADMRLLRRGNRLSVLPVEADEYKKIVKMGGRARKLD